MAEPPASKVGGDIRPLYAAGFVTAFGAHAVAATWGAESAARSLLQLGLVVAVYDLAEVLLKPVFGTLADRWGPRPVIVSGLLAFGLVSLLGAVSTAPVVVLLVRFGQGAAASAFSPAASAAVSRLASPAARGHAFGRYGSWKSLGYVAGPLVGSALAVLGGVRLLQLVVAALGFGVALWVAIRAPVIAPLPRRRPTLLDVLRESTERRFLAGVLPLAASAGALVAGIGFLPARAVRLDAGLVGAAAVASVLAIVLALMQPAVGRWVDRSPAAARRMPWVSSVICALGLALAAWSPALPALILAAAALGSGIALATPSGYAALAAATAPEHIGRILGTAEMGRELGDALAPALVGAVAAVAGLGAGLGALALVLLVVAIASASIGRALRAAAPAP